MTSASTLPLSSVPYGNLAFATTNEVPSPSSATLVLTRTALGDSRLRAAHHIESMHLLPTLGDPLGICVSPPPYRGGHMLPQALEARTADPFPQTALPKQSLPCV